MAETAGLPPRSSGVVATAGSGIVARTAPVVSAGSDDDDYDISGYDLSRYETNGANGADHPAEPLRLTGSDDPDAADEDDEDEDGEDGDDEPVGAGAGGRRRSRRGGTRRRTRP
nr:hypothetical protein GCM10020092_092070 [Actinoplanes digitatis]